MTRFTWTKTMVALTVGLALALVGCDGDEEMDAGPPGTDAGPPGTDAGPPGMDAGPPDTDAGPPDTDAGDSDGGGDTDAGMGDAGMVGGGAATSTQIQAVIDAADGATTLMIDDAVVSYVKGSFGGGVDQAGFFLQAEQMGPALYVNVDPATLTPAPMVGDVVDLQVDMKNTSGGIPYAEAISMWNVDSSGNPTAFLVQDVTMVDLVTNLDDYTSELISVTGVTIEADFGFGGSGFLAADVSTTGVPTSTGDLRMRVPDSLHMGSALRFACTVDVGPSPLWRFNTTAQISAWAASDFTVASCPAPGPNDMRITEIGYIFTGSDDGKQFVEILNPTTDLAFELTGCRLADDGGFTDANAVEVASPLIVAPGQRVVFAGPMATSEIAGDVEIPAGTLVFDSTDLAQVGCACVAAGDCSDTVDTVDWSSMDFPDEIEEVSVQLSAGATDNDDLTNWCGTPMADTYGSMGRRGTPGAANVACPCPAVTHLVISEIDYDQSGSDNAEFVEIYNPTGSAIDLSAYSIVAINGSGDPAPDYADVALSGSLAAGAYAVITTSSSGSLTVPGGVMTFALGSSLQNGPDGVMLVDTSGTTDVLVDAVVYEGMLSQGDTPGGDTLTLGTQGENAGTDPTSGSLARRVSVNICDRDTPGADWGTTTMVTVGTANMFP